jgi:hypothetical protein
MHNPSVMVAYKSLSKYSPSFWASIIGFFLSPMEITGTQSKPYDFSNPMVDLAYNTLIIAMCLLGELSNLRGFLFQKRWRGFWKPQDFIYFS